MRQLRRLADPNDLGTNDHRHILLDLQIGIEQELVVIIKR